MYKIDSTYNFYLTVLKNYSIYYSETSQLNQYNFCSIYDLYYASGDVKTKYFDSSYSSFFNSRNEMTGIGIRLDSISSGYLVLYVYKGSPASAAGIQKDDILVSADMRSVIGVPFDSLSSILNGTAGQNKKLQILRNNMKYDYNITLATFGLPTIYSNDLDDYTTNVAIYDFYNKGESTAVELLNILSSNEHNLIIDMRNCLGGDFDAVLASVSCILPSEKEFVSAQMRIYDESLVSARTVDSLIRVKNGNAQFNRKIAIVIGKDTRAAGEMFSICLRKAYSNSILMGHTTYGEATWSRTFLGPDNGLAVVTFAKLKTPDGISWDKTGINPDIVIEDDKDPVDAAYQYLNGGLSKRSEGIVTKNSRFNENSMCMRYRNSVF